MKKTIQVITQALPIIGMVALIPFIHNDYVLTAIYCVIIIASHFFSQYTKVDLIVLTVGFSSMIFFEYIFISTGVEVFLRNSLFGIMPLWLPFLWAYGFVVIKRSVKILEQ
jgi:hypothetical protein